MFRVFACSHATRMRQKVKANKVLVIRTTNNLINSGPVIRTVFLTDQTQYVFAQNSLFIFHSGPHRSEANVKQVFALC